MTRDEAYTILKKYLKNENLIKHSLACEAAMKAVYKFKHKDPDYSADNELKWAIVGLLHDADYEMAQEQNNLTNHGLLIVAHEPSIPADIANAIKAHNYQETHVEPKTLMDWAIVCVDQLTGLIIASTLVHPDKKLASVTPDFIMNRYYERSFAKGADRDAIALSESKLGIPLTQFVGLTLKAMQEISTDLGL
jgi:predicted hydrolase (HD superfamily)